QIVFVEVKAGVSTVSTRERQIRDAVEARRVAWRLINIAPPAPDRGEPETVPLTPPSSPDGRGSGRISPPIAGTQTSTSASGSRASTSARPDGKLPFGDTASQSPTSAASTVAAPARAPASPKKHQRSIAGPSGRSDPP